MRSITPSSISTATGVMARAVISATVAPQSSARIVDRQNGLHHLGLAHQPHHDLGDQRHGAFRARQQAGQIVARQRPAALPPVVDDGPVRQHQLEAAARDWWSRRTPACAARRRSRRRCRRWCRRAGSKDRARRSNRATCTASVISRLTTPGLHHRALVFEIDLENAVHAREADDDAALRAEWRRRSDRFPRPVPTIGTPNSAAILTIAATSSVIARKHHQLRQRPCPRCRRIRRVRGLRAGRDIRAGPAVRSVFVLASGGSMAAQQRLHVAEHPAVGPVLFADDLLDDFAVARR